jgi:hypothetical protein
MCQNRSDIMPIQGYIVSEHVNVKEIIFSHNSFQFFLFTSHERLKTHMVI